MNKRFFILVSILLILTMALSACSAAQSASASASASVSTVSTNQSNTNAQSDGQTPPGGGQNPPGGGQGGNDTTEVTGTASYSVTDNQTKSGQTYTASNKDESAIIASGGGNLTLSNSNVTTSGDSSSMDSSSFYGLNAAVLAQKGSTVTLNNSKVTTTGSGANGVFATGEGAVINLTDDVINCTATGAHGVDATLGGTLNLTNVDISTAGDGASAAIATDRGGGTITVTGGTIKTTGTKSPAVYSTGNITVNKATMSSTNSESVVIEGKNSVTLNDCTATTTKNYGVFIYQSMSGDAEVGSGTFTMNGGSLTASDGPLFYSTNTTAVINLKGVTLSGASGVLLKAGADQWGTSGSNGSAITFNADSQTLSGNIVLDNISTLDLILKNSSSFTGAVNNANTAKSVTLTLDSTSKWNVTADSYLNAITDSDTSLSNIISNGHNVYYDATNSANSWLKGATVTLPGGGLLEPSK